ncbi:MAG: hypothetical protein ACFFDH_03505 [Promethearchaeota archaeon]
MTKSKIQRKKITQLLVILCLLILGIFHLNSGYAIPKQGKGASVYPDFFNPIQYGTFIPEPNQYAAMSIQARNQGEFTIMNWTGAPIDTETVNQTGKDISSLYPWYFDNYMMDSTTNNDYINPWIDVNWINVSSQNPHDVVLAPYTFNSVYNYYTMTEGSTLTATLNSSIPIEIDILIKSNGPKIVKINWLTDDPNANPLSGGNYNLVSPSGKLVDCYIESAEFNVVMHYNEQLFDYLVFVAHETGTYRLLLKADYDESTLLNLEFLDTPMSNLPVNDLIYDGNADENPSGQDGWDTSWQNNWYKIRGEKGDLFKLEIGIDYYGINPAVNLWTPSENGYIKTPLGGDVVYDIYFPMTGTAYLSFIDESFDWWYRYSLLLTEFDVLNYTIGYDPFFIRLSRDQRKAIEFEIEEPCFVQFNYTTFSQPAGEPEIYADGTPYSFLFEDSNDLDGYAIISPIKTKLVGSETFYYYYFPNGTYKALVKNINTEYEGLTQITSKYAEFVNRTFPITSLTYPDTGATEFLNLEFDPIENHNILYEPKYVYINITEPGQYLLNTTISASDNLGAFSNSTDPTAVVVYDNTGTGGEYYHDWTEEALDPQKSFPAFSNDTSGEQTGDMLYIAYTQKWHNMEFNFTQLGVKESGLLDLEFYIYDGNDFNNEVDFTLDSTDEFTSNGTIVLNMDDPDYKNWVQGETDFDFPNIDEEYYYWFAIKLENMFDADDDYNPLPYIQTLKLSNLSLAGFVNFVLLRESGYEYSDYWNVTILDASSLNINQLPEFSSDSVDTHIVDPFLYGAGFDPHIVNLEEGVYKLLIIPHGWGYPGTITFDFSFENYWLYKYQDSYNISTLSPKPNLYLHQIKDYLTYGYGEELVSIYNYNKIVQYNDTESSVPMFGGNSYFILECYGTAYQWTQLVISTNNVSAYNLYLMQDLPWSYNAPNFEVMPLASVSGPLLNSTYEFGVFTDHFFLLFEVSDIDELITFRIALSQYDTSMLTASLPIALFSSPSNDQDILVLGLAIGIPVVAGAAVGVIYILKRRGKILTKAP